MKIQEAKIFIEEHLLSEVHVGSGYGAMILEDLFGIRNLLSDRDFSPAEIDCVMEVVEKINQGVPLQYAVGLAHFYGRRFIVNNDVLIPRPETEELVFNVLEFLDQRKGEHLDVLDIGTGSGCIAVTLKKEVPEWRIQALDLSAKALEVARENAKELEADIEFILDDITNLQNQKMTKSSWDLIVSNPPYISKYELEQMDEHVLIHEPSMALFPEDGSPINMYESILRYGKLTLKKDGLMSLELNEFLTKEIEKLAVELGYHKVRIVTDLQGKNRMLFAEKA